MIALKQNSLFSISVMLNVEIQLDLHPYYRDLFKNVPQKVRMGMKMKFFLVMSFVYQMINLLKMKNSYAAVWGFGVLSPSIETELRLQECCL
mmetsp:Transcript_26052/g.24905  ORF Transcript_26052/g.24905 Transcript_26052/m.24905 type:complete len:92 (-) Transcript_26052:530-805(-)